MPYGKLVSLLEIQENKITALDRKMQNLFISSFFLLPKKAIIRILECPSTLPRHTIELFRDVIYMIKSMNYIPLDFKYSNITSYHNKLVTFFNLFKSTRNRTLLQEITLPNYILDYKVHIPKDEQELKLIGLRMGNCIYSYASKIIDKETNVFFLLKNEEPYICVEFFKTNLGQCKYRFNVDVDYELRSRIKESIFPI